MKSWVIVYIWCDHSYIKNPNLQTIGTERLNVGQVHGNAKPSCGLSMDVNSVCGKDQPQLSSPRRLKPETAPLQK